MDAGWTGLQPGNNTTVSVFVLTSGPFTYHPFIIYSILFVCHLAQQVTGNGMSYGAQH